MLLEGKTLENLTEADLQALITFQVRESRTVDYKLQFHFGTDAEKREFLADVVSFANASGGYLVYGMAEAYGLPTALTGLDLPDAELLINGLENSIRSSIQPRITGFKTQAIPLENGRIALVLHIPRSWAAPHAVTFGGSLRFFARNSSGKYPLDVTDLRAAYARSEGIAHQIRQFRMERLQLVASANLPVPMPSSPKIVFHAVPFQSLDPAFQVDIAKFSGQIRDRLTLMQDAGLRYRYNFDGYLAYSKLNPRQEVEGYAQFFRNGILEVVDASLLRSKAEEKPFVPATQMEQAIIRISQSFLTLYETISASPPFMFALSLVDVRGFYLAVNAQQVLHNHTIDRDVLMVPELLVERFEGDIAQLLRKSFDVVWQAAGYPRSLNYD